MEMHDTGRLAAVDHHRLRFLGGSGHATGQILTQSGFNRSDFAQMVPSSFCPARKNLFGSTASPRTRVS